jgi:hypothetical protein
MIEAALSESAYGDGCSLVWILDMSLQGTSLYNNELCVNQTETVPVCMCVKKESLLGATYHPIVPAYLISTKPHQTN